MTKRQSLIRYQLARRSSNPALDSRNNHPMWADCRNRYKHYRDVTRTPYAFAAVETQDPIVAMMYATLEVL